MLSKSQVKFIQQLSQKKYRVHHGLFVVEGHKSIEEFIHAGYSPKDLYVTDHHLFRGYDALCIASQQMKSISHLKTPSNALAVFPTPSHTVLKETDLILTLDAIQDPGNMGTLIRLCDWFGVRYLVCSYDTVDCYNPKVVRSSMGSLARVEVHYVDLPSWLSTQEDYKILGATMSGENMYSTSTPKRSILVIGNEGKGLSKAVAEQLDKEVSIPSYGKAESLNAAMAAGILMAEIKRSQATQI